MIVNKLKLNNPGFPSNLARIASPPPQLYWTGRPIEEWINRPKVTIVGSRKPTAYGRWVTNKLATELAESGVVIISGLAFGIDITAHQAALNAGGTTVAVLPSSIDDIYPRSHISIAERITEKGTLVTEYNTAGIAFKSNFIARNRLVSGLADVVLITEAALKSGSLHTARFALEQGKTVMAVPGNINSPASEGCNNLIKSGAVPVTSVNDIFFDLKLDIKSTRRAFSGSGTEKLIFDYIKDGLSSQEDLAMAARLSGPTLASTLTMLELSGHIRPAGSGNWVLA
jgi:DNA processing protein